jgi:hypothetical protein
MEKLTGQASRYGTNLIRHNKNISYVQLMANMEQRFNHANETETLQVQFYSARQSPTESTDEWADMLSNLADKSFMDLGFSMDATFPAALSVSACKNFVIICDWT